MQLINLVIFLTFLFWACGKEQKNSRSLKDGSANESSAEVIVQESEDVEKPEEKPQVTKDPEPEVVEQPVASTMPSPPKLSPNPIPSNILGEALAFTSLFSGDNLPASNTEAQRFVVSSEAEWQNMWQNLGASPADASAPAIDLTQYTVFALVETMLTDLGVVTFDGVMLEEGKAGIWFTKWSPDQAACQGLTENVTRPYHFGQVEKQLLADVIQYEFLVRRAKHSCPAE